MLVTSKRSAARAGDADITPMPAAIRPTHVRRSILIIMEDSCVSGARTQQHIILYVEILCRPTLSEPLRILSHNWVEPNRA
jgi:hypothetical protein